MDGDANDNRYSPRPQLETTSAREWSELGSRDLDHRTRGDEGGAGSDRIKAFGAVDIAATLWRDAFDSRRTQPHSVHRSSRQHHTRSLKLTSRRSRSGQLRLV